MSDTNGPQPPNGDPRRPGQDPYKYNPYDPTQRPGRPTPPVPGPTEPFGTGPAYDRTQQYGAADQNAGLPYPAAGQPVGSPPPGAPPYGYPGPGPYPPPPNNSSKAGIWIAVIAVVVLVGGLVTFFIVRGDDSPSTVAASSSTSTASSTETYPSSGAPSYSTQPSYTYEPPATSTTSSVTYYGSIAVSRTTGNVGYATNSLTESAAVDAALSQCGQSSCETVVRFWNACGAVAQSQANLYWGWGYAGTRQGAIDQAVSHVQGAQPKLLTAQCTLNAGDSSAGGSAS